MSDLGSQDQIYEILELAGSLSKLQRLVAMEMNFRKGRWPSPAILDF